MSSTTAVVTCPACEEELPIEMHPVRDWKRGSVQLEIILTEDAIVHLEDHFGGTPITPDTEAPVEHATEDSPEPAQADAVPVADPADQPAAEPVTETAQETPEVTPDKAISKTKTRTKTA